MRIITCAGFYRTGSSAISDFFSEFDNCKSLGDVEFRFVQDPDGISDLEYNLVENPHRHNSSNSIKRFIKISKFNNGGPFSKRYSRYFGKNYKTLTEKYVQNISSLICRAWWHVDQINKGRAVYLFDRIVSKVSSLFSKYRENLSPSCHNELAYYSNVSEEEFLKYTKEYTDDLFSCVSKGSDFLLADQLVPPTNIDRYLRYFKDIKVIVVDRDPRDLFYIENKFYRWGIIPHRNVVEFCKWFRITREQALKTKSSKALYLRFEDFVFNYEKTSKIIMDFVGISCEQHVRPLSFFDPEKSKRSIGLYKNDNRFKSQIEYIEKELKEYCYGFEQ